MRVHVVGTDTAVSLMFQAAGWDVFDDESVVSLTEPKHMDLVCFTGGVDVSPALYLEENTASYPIADRDLRDIGWFLHYDHMDYNPAMVGICRGGQLLNVLSGGRMIQHIDGHSTGMRDIRMSGSGSLVKIHEDHHQGMVPAPYGKVIARDPRDDNPEIVVYHEGPDDAWEFLSPRLCFQPHPEWGHDGTRNLFFQLIGEYLL